MALARSLNVKPLQAFEASISSAYCEISNVPPRAMILIRYEINTGYSYINTVLEDVNLRISCRASDTVNIQYEYLQSEF